MNSKSYRPIVAALHALTNSIANNLELRIVAADVARWRCSVVFDGLLETVQELLLELDDLLDVAEEPFDVFAREERLGLERLQVPVDQTVDVLCQLN